MPAIGARNQNTAGQPDTSMSAPPMMGPSAAPSANIIA